MHDRDSGQGALPEIIFGLIALLSLLASRAYADEASLRFTALAQDPSAGPKVAAGISGAFEVELGLGDLRFEAGFGGGDTPLGSALVASLEASFAWSARTSTAYHYAAVGIEILGTTLAEQRDGFGGAPNFTLLWPTIEVGYRTTGLPTGRMSLRYGLPDDETRSSFLELAAEWRITRLRVRWYDRGDVLGPFGPIGPDGLSVALGLRWWRLRR